MYNMDGQPGMADYMAVRFNCLNRYEGLDHVSACLTEPLAVSLTSVLNAQIPLGGSVVVLGPGPLGLMSARVAKLHGAGYVAITGLPAKTACEKARLELAPKMGCDDVIEVGPQDVETEIKKKFPDGVDRGDRFLTAGEPLRRLEDHQVRRGSSLSMGFTSAGGARSRST